MNPEGYCEDCHYSYRDQGPYKCPGGCRGICPCGCRCKDVPDPVQDFTVTPAAIQNLADYFAIQRMVVDYYERAGRWPNRNTDDQWRAAHERLVKAGYGHLDLAVDEVHSVLCPQERRRRTPSPNDVPSVIPPAEQRPWDRDPALVLAKVEEQRRQQAQLPTCPGGRVRGPSDPPGPEYIGPSSSHTWTVDSWERGPRHPAWKKIRIHCASCAHHQVVGYEQALALLGPTWSIRPVTKRLRWTPSGLVEVECEPGYRQFVQEQPEMA